MDRVSIDSEPRGSATYYMAEAPQTYGDRIYEMESLHELDISSVRMDVGHEQGASWCDVNSAEEYNELIWKTCAEVYTCVFDIVKHTEKGSDRRDLPITVRLEFLSKRLTLQVDPELDAQEKKQLAEFYNMLTDEDYFLDREIDLLAEDVAGIHHFSKIGKAALAIMILVAIVWIIISDEDPEAAPNLLTIFLGGFSLLISLIDGIRQHLIKRVAKRKLSEAIEKSETKEKS